MNQKTIKCLAKINIILDNEQHKLYDKLKNIELSHNRKYKLLQDIEQKLRFFTRCWGINESLSFELINLIEKIDKELTFTGSVKGDF